MASLNSNQLILADSKNISLKLVDLSKNSVIDQLKLDNYPLDVTALDDGECAVTVPVEQTIHFISVTEETLTFSDEKLQVEGDCRGLYFYGKRLLVTYGCPSKLQIMELNGTVLKTVMINSMQYLIFSEPYYVTATNNHIIVSDLGQSEITRLNWNGEVLESFTTDGSPHGVAVIENGFLFVAGSHIKQCNNQNEIDNVAPDLEFPYAIVYSETNRVLIVSFHKGYSKNDNYLQVLERM
jgi:hypothetical protein